MKIPFYKKASFWNLVIQSGQIILGTFQGITLAVEKNIMDVNIWFAGVQAGLGVISIWTADRNSNNIIDIAEEIDVTITSSSPINVTTEVTPKPET